MEAICRKCASLVLALIFLSGLSEAYSQCIGLPAVSALGSNKVPVGLCAPVNANLVYSVQFASPVPAGTLELIYDWGDGSPAEVIQMTPGARAYREERIHNFPEESGCEYVVSMIMRYNGTLCSNTRQIQKISSWRTDAFNGGDIGLKSPVTNSTEHLVCEGSDVDIIFSDNSVFNCNAQYVQLPPDAIEAPNVEDRWQQIIYNGPVAGSKIPNIMVDGVLLTSASRTDIYSNYQDPRGVFHMASPVLVNDPRRRPSLQITAPGGFGTGFPKAGDSFTLTLRYWNFCNPYDDPNIAGPPADPINGDHPPIEEVSTIRIIAPPSAPTTTNESVCHGVTPKAFSVSGVPAGNQVRWYENISNPDRPGRLLATTKTLAMGSHPEWRSNTTAGVYKVWASHQSVATGAISCESPKTLVTRTIREKLEIADAASTLEVCNASTLTISFPAPAIREVGGPTKYSWQGSDGLTLATSTSSSADFDVDVKDFGGALFVERTVTVSHSYSGAPACAVSKVYPVKIYRLPTGGSVSTVGSTCEGSEIDTIRVTGYVGQIKRWEVQKDNGPFTALTGVSGENFIVPQNLTAGSYAFRALVENGSCPASYSSETKFEVFANPVTITAGNDQFHCGPLVSLPLRATSPSIGSGRWSIVSTVPDGLPEPAFSSITDANATISIQSRNAGTYTLRWTVINGTCQMSDDVIVDFGTNPSEASAGTDQKVCGSETTLQGNVPEKGTGSWSVVSGPANCTGETCPIILDNPRSAKSLARLSTEGAYGTYTFRWSISSGGNSCFLKTDDVNVTFERPMVVQANDTDPVCLDPEKLVPIALTGTVEGTFGDASWVNVNGKGSVSESSSISGKISAYYHPVIEDYTAGTPVVVKLVATPPSGSGCTIVERAININIDRMPVADAGTDFPSLCTGEVKLAATTPMYGATGVWTSRDKSISFSDKTNPKSIVRNIPVASGKASVSWTVTSASGLCVSLPSTIELNRVRPPQVMDVTVSQCESVNSTTEVTLSNFENRVTPLSPAQRQVTWYKTTTESSVIPLDGNSVQPGIANGQRFNAVVKDVNTQCADTAIVTLMVPESPKVINGLVSVCEEVPGSKKISSINLSELKYREAITKEADVEIEWYSSMTDAQQDVRPVTSKVDVVQGMEFFARITKKASPYCFAVTKLTVVVNSIPAVGAIFGRESVCQGDPAAMPGDLPVETYQVTPIPGAKYHWEVPAAEKQFRVFGGGREGDFYLLMQFPNGYSGKIKVRPELNGCSGPVMEKEINVSAAPVRPTIVGESIVYKNSKAVAFRVTPNNHPTSSYNWEIRRKSDNSFGGAYIIEGQSTGNILINMLSEDIILSVRENNATCTSPVTTKIVSVMEPPKAEDLAAAFKATPTASCFPATITVTNLSTAADTYVWKLSNQNGIVATSNLINPQFAISSPGTYQLHLTATQSYSGESDHAELHNIQVLDVPYAAFNMNSEVVYAPDSELKLLNFSSRAETYLWSFGDGETSELFEPTHTYLKEGVYTISLLAGIDHGHLDTDGDGVSNGPLVCYDTAKMTVTARNGGNIKIPNAFTPDESGPNGGHATSGGFNDVFRPLMQGVKLYRMQIFDRWGTKIFESNDPDIGWDGYDRSGVLMSAGVYVYKIEVTLSNGQKETRMGDVGLIR